MKLILGIIIGVILVLSIKTIHADSNNLIKIGAYEQFGYASNPIYKMIDGNVNCYFSGNGGTSITAISCVKVK